VAGGSPSLSFIEGRGYVAPGTTSILLNEEETRIVREYARNLSSLKKYSFENCFVGLSGEAALGKHILEETGIGRVANWELYDNEGDGGVDMKIAGLTIQVKTRFKGKENRVKRYTDDFITLESQFYVFCQVINQGINYTHIDLLGWVSENELRQLGEFRKHKDNWFIEVESKYLYPISRLITRIKNESYQVSRQQRKVSPHYR
jgi:hypothetical protein